MTRQQEAQNKEREKITCGKDYKFAQLDDAKIESMIRDLVQQQQKNQNQLQNKSMCILLYCHNSLRESYAGRQSGELIATDVDKFE